MNKNRRCIICTKNTENFCSMCDVGICCSDHWSEHCKNARKRHDEYYEKIRKERGTNYYDD